MPRPKKIAVRKSVVRASKKTLPSQKSPLKSKKITAQKGRVVLRKKTVGKTKKLLPVASIEAAYKSSVEKFYTAVETKPEYTPATEELPQKYGEDKIVLQVRDPWWLHAYWEVRSQTVEGIRGNVGNKFDGARSVLRVYDVSFIRFNGKNAHRYFDIDISLDANSWYIDAGIAGRSWIVDIGFRLKDGTFILIARSNAVTTPTDGPSWMTDEEWMIPEDKFAALYGMGFGFGAVSSPGKKGWTQRFKMPISSPGLFSLSSPVRWQKPQKRQRGFWFKVDTELIVHGATEPDAKVMVSGHPVELNRDGTFMLRFHLPNGIKTVPVVAQSADGIDTLSATPVVSRETR